MPNRSRMALIRYSPKLNHFKVKFDGSKLKNGKAAFGFVIPNHLGDMLLAEANSIGPSCSTVQAKAWDLKEDLKAACFLIIDNIIVEGDNSWLSTSFSENHVEA